MSVARRARALVSRGSPAGRGLRRAVETPHTRRGRGMALLVIVAAAGSVALTAAVGVGDDDPGVTVDERAQAGDTTAPATEPGRLSPSLHASPDDTPAAAEVDDAPTSPNERSAPDTTVATWLDDLDDEGRIGQVLMLRVYGGDIDEADPRNEARYGVATPREVIETFRPGGVLLFRTDAGRDTGNLRDPQQVRQFTDDLRKVSAEVGPPVTVAIDQEGGAVDRIGHFGTPYPTARQLAEDPQAAAEHAETTVRELAALGIDMNFAPVADVDSEPANPIIGDRAYSSDPEVVAEMVVTQLEQYRDGPVVAGLKHFPGHGDTTQDSHTTLPRVDADLEQLRTRELVPFAAAIEAGAEVIMTAHLELPEVSGPGVPASMSSRVVTDLLRDELGFEGLVVTDSLEMAGAQVDRPDDRVALHALLAGHDLLVLPPVPRESKALLEQALATDQLPEDRLEASVERILELKARLQDVGYRPGPEVVGTG